ncbi:snRNA-activating protein complex subunit 1b [Syngnathoides biaculeatus]|uniref:snRNA-activating protein complex subunit 1b n=1 Tax=Syngnathoides biaculeatus TaxID=300417 RepID=UPI002ADDBF55|nr:snRNA-activating protein complex subunit 1b [Syngnathoides biaculeatus]
MNSSRRWKQEVRSDCEELLARFQRTDCVRFETFSKIWREMNFGRIFFGTAGHQKRAFSRLALDVAFVYFLPPFSFQIRVGGLYLLYGLYHCQTASPRAGIGVALKDWTDVLSFEKDAREARHLDAIFVLRQLRFQKAFRFSATPLALTFERRPKEVRSQLGNKFVARACGPQELLDRDALEELSNVHELYKQLKSSVRSPAQRERLGLDVTRDDLPALLRGHVVDFHSWQKTERQEASDGDEDVAEGTSTREESVHRAQLLSSIKSKAYGQAAQVCKSRRHREVGVDSSGPAPQKGRSASRKISLKARTHEKVRIAGEMWKEATTSTSINCLTAMERGPQAKKEERS